MRFSSYCCWDCLRNTFPRFLQGIRIPPGSPLEIPPMICPGIYHKNLNIQVLLKKKNSRRNLSSYFSKNTFSYRFKKFCLLRFLHIFIFLKHLKGFLHRFPSEIPVVDLPDIFQGFIQGILFGIRPEICAWTHPRFLFALPSTPLLV